MVPGLTLPITWLALLVQDFVQPSLCTETRFQLDGVACSSWVVGVIVTMVSSEWGVVTAECN